MTAVCVNRYPDSRLRVKLDMKSSRGIGGGVFNQLVTLTTVQPIVQARALSQYVVYPQHLFTPAAYLSTVVSPPHPQPYRGMNMSDTTTQWGLPANRVLSYT